MIDHRRTIPRACRVALITSLLALSAAAPAPSSLSNRELVEVTDLDGLSFSPVGRYAVFRTERADVVANSYILRWHSVDLFTGTVKDIGSGGYPIYVDPGSIQREKPVWTGDGRSIVVRALDDGRVGLWRADVFGHGMTSIVSGDADVLDYGPGSAPDIVEYQVGASRDQVRRAEQAEYDAGILVDSTVDLEANLFRGASIQGKMSTQRLVGYWFVKNALLWRAPRQRRQINANTKVDEPVGAPVPMGPFKLVNELDDPSVKSERGHVARSKSEAGSSLLSAEMADGRKVVCKDPVCEAHTPSWMAWRPGSDDLMLSFTKHAMRTSLYRWQTQSNRLVKVASFEGILSGGRRSFWPCAVSAARALCVAAGPASPPRLVSIDLVSGATTTLFDPNSAVRSAYQPEVRFLEWPIGGGKEAAGVVMVPSDGRQRPRPLYLNYNRCEGFLRGGEGDEWPMPELLAAGYAVACIKQVPLTGKQDAVQTYRIGLDAVRTLIGKLARDEVVDRSKVAMGGLSFGSEVAFWTAMHSDLLATLSVSSAQNEPSTYWSNARPGSDMPGIMKAVWGFGAPDETPQPWETASPALNADKIRIPVLLQLPEAEARRVPELYARLTKQGTPTELYAFPDEGHIKVQPRHRLAIYERNLDWFRYWLEEYRDSDPAKKAQYDRWEQLKLGWQEDGKRAGASTL